MCERFRKVKRRVQSNIQVCALGLRKFGVTIGADPQPTEILTYSRSILTYMSTVLISSFVYWELNPTRPKRPFFKDKMIKAATVNARATVWF